MPRVKRGLHHVKRRKGIMKRVKGFEAGRKNLIKLAQTAQTKAGAHAYRDRRVKKRLTRQLWQVKINAAVRALGMSYSVFTGALKKHNIMIDRKVLSQIAEKHPAVFTKIVEEVK
ncbi:MAG TPA: 50S ribosomal protein L20 [Candidatus Magasanikbacteria bacterium]|nr:MAG: 50S ribosomal protein L20 [Candidatus Magasanikbacteria bacterium RIFOXYC2_FULL_39_8]HAT03368.1 50S ribosomal protein L20 [Candidatus Magasanikbacteria bacterium]